MIKNLEKTALFVAMSLFSFSVCAQRVITGRVVGQSTSENIVGAVVTLYENDSVKTVQSQTDMNGLFSITSNGVGDVTVIVSMIGYKPETIEVIGEDSEINIGYVYLAESAVALDEVTVYGSGIIEKVDKYVVLPSAEQRDRASQTIDLFAQLDLPGLRSDPILRKITVEGGNPVYLIGGRQQNLNRILNLNPRDILRIEYSNNPGPRYIERGYTGVINVVLRDRVSGGSVYGYAQSAVTTGNADAGVQGSYNTNKSEFVVSYDFSYRKYKHWKADGWERYISSDMDMMRESEGIESDMYYQYHNVEFEYNYTPELNTLFSAKLTNTFNDNDADRFYNMFVKNWDSTTDNYLNNVTAGGHSYSPTLDLAFIKSLKNKQSIEFNLVGSYSDNTNSMFNKYIYPDVSDSRNWSVDNSSKRHGYGIAGEAVYGKNFGKVTARFGVQHRYSWRTTEYVENNQKEDQSSNITYVYGELQGNFNKLNYNLGAGLKVQTSKTGSLSNTSVSNNTSLTLMMNLGKGWSFNYIILNRPNVLPSLGQLTEIERTSDYYLISTGNPNLKAGNLLYNRFQVRYAHKCGFTATFRVKYGRTFNPIVGTYTYDESKQRFYVKPTNENYCDDPGVELNLGMQGLFKHLDLYGTVGYTHFESDGNTFHHTYDNVFAKISAQAYFGKWTISGYSYFAPTRYLKGESITQDQTSTALSVQYKFNNRIRVYANWSYLFGKDGWVYEEENLSNVHPTYSRVTISDQSNQISIGVSFNFNFGKNLKKSKKTLNNRNFDIKGGGL